MDHIARGKQVIEIETESLKKTSEALGDEFGIAVSCLLDALNQGGKIVVTGVGKNLHIAEKVSATLASTGASSLVLNPVQAMHGDLGVFNDGDVLLALSYSGESEEVIALVPLVKRLKIKIITLAGNPKSTLARESDICIPVAIEKEACPFNMAPTSSTTATLAVGDAIAMALLDARGFTEKDYAALHPGGAIGRALLLHVSDIMRKDDRLAIVTQGQSVKEAVLAMTGARSGSAAVVDADRVLLGILTDGDIRRHLVDDPDMMSKTVGDIMTTTPVTVRPDQLAAEVLRIFEEKDIDDLLVVDEGKRIVGAVDIQDLPKLKII